MTVIRAQNPEDAAVGAPTVRPHFSLRRRWLAATGAVAATLALAGCGSSTAESVGEAAGGEASLRSRPVRVTVIGGGSGRTLLLRRPAGLRVSGIGFGILSYAQLRRLPVHASMREISELIYSTCKAYLLQQGKFLLVLWVFIATVIVVYYGFLVGFPWARVAIVIAFSLVGMAGSYSVAWFGIRVNTFANSRTAFASLRRQAAARCTASR